MSNDELIQELTRLATELENCVCKVFAPGKHTEMDIVHMRPGLRPKIIAALREKSVPAPIRPVQEVRVNE